MRQYLILIVCLSLVVFANVKKPETTNVDNPSTLNIDDTGYEFSPVELGYLDYYKMHPNHYELQSSVLAFPGAKGFGKFVTGGRGGIVVRVTNLNDSGAGSLRAAIDQTVTRNIVFDVGGDINLSNSLRIDENEGNLTIAGETAPSPGITIRAENIGGSNYGGALDIVGADNIIIRYISIRGTNSNGATIDAIRLEGGTTSVNGIIIDHCSLSHGTDEVFGFETVENATFSKNIYLQPTGSGISLVNNPVNNITVIENYLSHSYYRNFLVGYGAGITNFEFINNIIFGFNTGGTDVTYGSQVDVISNVYKQWGDKVSSPRIFHWAEHGYTGNLRTDGEFYIDGNIGANPSKMRDPLIDADDLSDSSPSRVVTGSYIISWETALSEIENTVLPTVGNSIYRDAEDTKAVADYYNEAAENTINPTNKTSGSHPTGYDTDSDGMADAWEVARSGSIALMANSDDDSDGYTNIEEFFHYRAGSESGSGGGSPIPTGLKRNFFNKKKGFF